MNSRQQASSSLICIVFIVLFVILCLIPSVGMFFAAQEQASANEILALPPSFTAADGNFNTHLLRDTSDYVADRFAFRKKLVNAWSVLNAAVFKTSAEKQVVLGKEGWLYYEPTLNDYMGRSMSDAELECAAKALFALQRSAEEKGACFVFTIAPNKNSLYGEQMPSYIPSAHDSSNAARLRPYLERYGVRYVDLFSVFSSEEDTLYYRTDSHWTERGAALAADALLSGMGKTSDYFNGPFSPGGGHLGDLYDMLYPTGNFRETSDLYVPGFSFTLDGDPKGGNALKIRTSCAGRSGRLLCWRDSFGISLYPYLSDSFEEAVFLRSTQYDPELIDSFGADYVLLEIVERNLAQLAVSDPANP